MLIDYLETERLILREFTLDDADFIFELLNSQGWLKNVGTRNISTTDDARNYISARLMPGYKEHGFGFYLVQLKDKNVSIGMCGLVKRDGLEDVDIGFAMLPAYEGKGFAYESSSAVYRYAADVLKLKRLSAITVQDNTASINLLKKLGFKFEKTVSIPGDDEELMLFTDRQ